MKWEVLECCEQLWDLHFLCAVQVECLTPSLSFSVFLFQCANHGHMRHINPWIGFFIIYIISIILSYGLYKCKIDFSTLPFITISWPHGLREIMGEFANNVSSTSANNLSRKPPGSADLILVLTPSDDLNSPRILPGLRKRPFYD